jgi:mannitol/fructose-specific phosphotransferase system IIA component (Ntr-type)
MHITDFLEEQCIKIPLTRIKKKDIIGELLELLYSRHPETKDKNAYQSLLEREKIETTAVGYGVAIPHARIKGLSTICIAFGIAREDLELDSLDGKPVRLVFLILFPEGAVSLQLSLLARISRFLKDTDLREKLLGCTTSSEVMDVFSESETHHFG